MQTWRELFDYLKPEPKTAIYAALTFIASLGFNAFRKRRIGLEWTVTRQKVAPCGGEVAGKLQIKMGEIVCQNLHWCTVHVRNVSGRDAEGFDLLFTFDPQFQIVESEAQIETSAKALMRSKEFQSTVAAVMAQSSEQRAINPSLSYILRNREYYVPALNRGEKIVASFWVNSGNTVVFPVFRVSTEKPGLREIFRPAQFQVLDQYLIKRMVAFGVVITIPVAYLVSSGPFHPTAMGFTCLAIGIANGFIGLGVIKLIEAINRLS